MQTVFLFGAGASFGSGAVNPCPPPLGRQLIDAVTWSPKVAAALTPKFKAAFRADFESAMVHFHNTHGPVVISFLKDLAAFFLPFQPAPKGNAYEELITQLGTYVSSCVFATTNYDLLIEFAMGRKGIGVSPAYPVAGGRGACLLKIHGSCNYLIDMGNTSIGELIIDLDYGNHHVEGRVRPEPDRNKVLRDCRNPGTPAPAIAIYGPGKPASSGHETIAMIQNRFRKCVLHATSIVIVGLLVNEQDDHIWGTLAEAPGEVLYVAPSEEDEVAFLTWARKTGHHNARMLEKYFQDAVPKMVSIATANAASRN